MRDGEVSERSGLDSWVVLCRVWQVVVWLALASRWFFFFLCSNPVHPVPHGGCQCWGLDWGFLFLRSADFRRRYEPWSVVMAA